MFMLHFVSVEERLIIKARVTLINVCGKNSAFQWKCFIFIVKNDE